MLASIQLDDKARLPAGEVNDVRTYGKLARELRSVATKQAPDRPFGFCRVGAKNASVSGKLRIDTACRHCRILAERRFAPTHP